jgi:hypothetical protein
MRKYRLNVATNVISLITGLTFISIAASAQQRGPGAAPPIMPGSVVRERSRDSDEYDREMNRLRNNARLAHERRQKLLFPQINEDFMRIQVIHNEMVRMVQSGGTPAYDRLEQLSAEMKKRSSRLKTNLALPEATKAEDDLKAGDKHKSLDSTSQGQIKESVAMLHDLMLSFVSNPIFQNLGVLDAKLVDKASRDLTTIIEVSESMKKAAETLIKTVKKS